MKKIDITDENKLKNTFKELLAADISTRGKLSSFEEKWDLIEKHVTNEWAESYFLMTTDVASEEKRKRQEHCDQVIVPLASEYGDKLNRKFLDSPIAQKLGSPYHILRRNMQSEIEIFQQENVEVKKEESKLRLEITEIQGKLTADWKGEKLPLPSLHPYFKVTDREERKQAFEALNDAELEVAEAIDEKFDQMLQLRQKMAANAGFDNYTDYRFKELKRFDWGTSHCFAFHDAVRKHILPLHDKQLEQRKKGLNLDVVRPYDRLVDPFGREPLQIYKKGESVTLIEGTSKIIKAIDDELFGYFSTIKRQRIPRPGRQGEQSARRVHVDVSGF